MGRCLAAGAAQLLGHDPAGPDEQDTDPQLAAGRNGPVDDDPRPVVAAHRIHGDARRPGKGAQASSTPIAGLPL